MGEIGLGLRRMVRLSLIVATVFAASAVASSEASAASTEDRYSIANGCFALQSANGGFVTQGAAGYQAAAGGPAGAEGFFLRATDLGRFLLYDQSREFVAVGGNAPGLGNAASAAPRPSDKVDFTVTKEGDGFRFSNRYVNRDLAVDGNGRLVGVPAGSAGAAGVFTLVEDTGCANYPEVQLNVKGEPSQGSPRYGEVSGTTDSHMHLMAFEFLGGKAHCGKPWDRFGPAFALRDCADHTATAGCGVPLETGTGGNTCHDPEGWPSFAGWPRPNSLTHEGSYYKWLERAWRGGLRLYTNLLVENRALCELYPLKKNSCNEFDSVKLQARRMNQLQNYIDAQEGGPGKGWFRIVRTPFEAREVINDGKLAVIMGMEVSEPFNCRITNDVSTCDAADVRAGMDEIWKLGVRQMELINKFDNSFSGVAGDDGETGVLTNAGNFYATGRFWDMGSCTDPDNADRNPTDVGDLHNDDDAIANGFRTLLPGGTVPDYPPGPNCNRKGLTSLGEVLVEKGMDQGMVLDPDHMSVLGRGALLSILEANDYSGVVASHSWSSKPALPRILGLGGYITPYAGDSEGFVEKWKTVKEAYSGRQYYGIGYGADMNGLGGQGEPRGADVPNPVTYPFQSLDPNVTVERNVSGQRTWDINTDGVSHYGLYPDWIEDLRMLAGDEITEDLNRGAEAYLQMWERARGVGEVRCPIWRGRFTPRGFQKPGAKRKRDTSRNIPLGRRSEGVLRQSGQPVSRQRLWEWCARSRRPVEERKRRMVAVFGGRSIDSQSSLVASTIHGQPAAGIEKGDRVRDLRKKATRSSKGLWVKRARRGASYFYGTRRGLVTYLGVTDTEIASKRGKLKRYVKRAGLRGGKRSKRS